MHQLDAMQVEVTFSLEGSAYLANVDSVSGSIRRKKTVPMGCTNIVVDGRFCTLLFSCGLGIRKLKKSDNGASPSFSNIAGARHGN